jgi:diaminopimelate decarboxylase
MLHAHLWPDTATTNQHGHLAIGGCDVVGLAREYGTPLYLLDEATFRNSCRAYLAALEHGYAGPAAAHYAGKALLNTGVAQLVAQEGLGLDVVSGGELYVALRAGFSAGRIHLHGNAKPRAELEQALEAGVGKIVVDTLDELGALAQLTAGRDTQQPIMLRLAPGVATDTHAHIQTGQAASKFGLPLDRLDAAAERILAAPGLRLTGLHCHLGSQLFGEAPYIQALGVLLDCAARLRERHGITISEISPGGGLGVPYLAEQAQPDKNTFVAAIGRALSDGCAARGLPLPRLVIEPGRSIVARACVAVYSVVATKPLSPTNHQLPTTDRSSDKETSRQADREIREATHEGTISASSAPPVSTSQPSSVVGRRSSAGRYLHIDGGMADNIRPALYGARYTARLANRPNHSLPSPVAMGEGSGVRASLELVHIAGRYCESGDVLLRDVALPPAGPGDLLAVAVAGAYTLSMASNYNLTPRPALLLVGDGRARVLQRRETYEDLVSRDLLL